MSYAKQILLIILAPLGIALTPIQLMALTSDLISWSGDYLIIANVWNLYVTTPVYDFFKLLRIDVNKLLIDYIAVGILLLTLDVRSRQITLTDSEARHFHKRPIFWISIITDIVFWPRHLIILSRYFIKSITRKKHLFYWQYIRYYATLFTPLVFYLVAVIFNLFGYDRFLFHIT